MYVASRADQLVPLFAKFNNFAVQILQILPGVDRTFLIPQHKCVVSKRLHFQIIVEICNFSQFFLRNPAQDRLKQLSRLARRPKNQPLAVARQQTLRNPRTFCKICQVRLGNQPVQVDSPDIILRQNNNMVGRHLPDHFRCHFAEFVELRQVFDITSL